MTYTKGISILDSHLQPEFKSGWSGIKDSADVNRKFYNLGRIPDNTTLITTEVVTLYAVIPYSDVLQALIEVLDK